MCCDSLLAVRWLLLTPAAPTPQEHTLYYYDNLMQNEGEKDAVEEAIGVCVFMCLCMCVCAILMINPIDYNERVHIMCV